tara:strand:- start:539 stop:673 length:135 start_codon:yes stop_codon:yes gene_type:complete
VNQRVTLKENTQKEKGIENHAQIEIKNFQEVDPENSLKILLQSN